MNSPYPKTKPLDIKLATGYGPELLKSPRGDSNP
jgi:hypothetical protein